jgi:dTMP kinase
MKTPRLVALEGIDGAGKTTVANALAHFEIPNVNLFCTGEMRSALGDLLRERLGRLSPVEKIYWFAADRASTLAIASHQGGDGRETTVVWDRYVDSARAYRGAEVELGLAPPSVLELVETINASFPAPDQVMFLDIDVESACRRLSVRPGNEDPRLSHVLSYYRRRASESGTTYVTIDAARPIDDVVRNVIKEMR